MSRVRKMIRSPASCVIAPWHTSMPLAMQPRALWRLPPPASNSPCTPGEAASERATRENLFHLFLQAEPTRESRRAVTLLFAGQPPTEGDRVSGRPKQQDGVGGGRDARGHDQRIKIDLLALATRLHRGALDRERTRHEVLALFRPGYGRID